jgi:hypothetical protein
MSELETAAGSGHTTHAFKQVRQGTLRSVEACDFDGGKWASDFAHAYYALVKGESDLGHLMDAAYAMLPMRQDESPLEVARQWFEAIPADRRARYLPGGEAYALHEKWKASLATAAQGQMNMHMDLKAA